MVQIQHARFIRSILSLAGLATALAMTACGKSGTVTVQSAAFPTTGEATVASAALAITPSTLVTDFKFCLKKVTLENAEGDAEQKEDESEIAFRPGLIDASSGEAVSWGEMELPAGFKLSRIKVKVGKDQALCGTNYSLKFNEETTPQDVEFRWKFAPAIELKDGDILTLALDSVVASLRQASDEGTLRSMKERIEGIEGQGHRNERK